MSTSTEGISAQAQAAGQDRPVVNLESATVRFAGDSGDGMQLAGTQLTNTSALGGNDVATFPDFPAEIRAPHDGELKTGEGVEIGQRKNEERTATPPESMEQETGGESKLEEAFK